MYMYIYCTFLLYMTWIIPVFDFRVQKKEHVNATDHQDDQMYSLVDLWLHSLATVRGWGSIVVLIIQKTNVNHLQKNESQKVCEQNWIIM